MGKNKALAQMSFDKIFDLTAGVFLFLYLVLYLSPCSHSTAATSIIVRAQQTSDPFQQRQHCIVWYPKYFGARDSRKQQ